MTRVLQIAVVLATVAVIVVNYFSATGLINNRDAGEVSDIYPTGITPAGYAFAIWSLIYIGSIGFTFYQLMPDSGKNVFLAKTRIPYLVLSAANIGWIFSWHYEMIPVTVALMLVLLVCLARINLVFAEVSDKGDIWLAKVPFAIYFGWVTVAAILNVTILFVYMGLEMGGSAETWAGVLLLAAATAIGIILRFRLDSMGYPLTIAWALTAIGVEQSGDTIIVLFTALGMMALIFFAFWGFVKDR